MESVEKTKEEEMIVRFDRLPSLLGVRFLLPLLVVLLIALPLAGYALAGRAAAPSRLIWGTNLGLFNSGDPFFNSGFRAEMSTIGVQTVRMPIRGATPSTAELSAMQTIKAMGAVPLVIMHGAADSNVLADDKTIVQDVASVFGSQRVLIEFGNEEDLAGIGVAQYTSSWNAVIPQVKPLDPAASFGGPVNFQYNSSYIHTFTQTANPAADFISWHEYTCPNEASGYCISHIANWANHLADYHSYSQLPVYITEYNYSPNEATSDSAFLMQWMTTAMEEWVSLNVAGAFQYRVDVNSGTSGLIDQGTNAAVAEGQVMQAEHNKYFGNLTPTPTPPSTSTPSPTPPPPGNGLQQQFQAAWNQGTFPSSGPLYTACLKAALTRHIIVGTPIRSFPSTDWGSVALIYTEFTSGDHAEMHSDNVVRIYTSANVEVYP